MKTALIVFVIIQILFDVLVGINGKHLQKIIELILNIIELKDDRHKKHISALERTINFKDIKVRYKLHADIPIPQQTSKGDWIDLYASEDVYLGEGEYKVIPLGISMELPKGYGAIVAPRSSTMKNFGIRMTNSIGIIDNSYCGDNDIWGFCAVADRNTTIHKGDKIAQFMIYPVMPKVVFERTLLLGNEDRGGYGSTGTR